MGLFRKKKKTTHGRTSKKNAYCTECGKWYDPNNKRQFKKHGHKK